MKTRTLLLLTMVLSLSFPLFSQEKGKIIYTDFEPDSVIYPVWFAGNPIDVNYNGIKELRFKRESRWGYGMLLCEQNEDVDILKIPSNSSNPLSEYTDSQWEYYHIIDLLPYGDYDVGLRYTANDSIYYYGWIRFNVKNVCSTDHIPSLTIYDMAYCTIPNYPLIFGQSNFTDVDENGYKLPEAMLFPNPADDKLSLRISGDISCDNVMIYGIDGRLLKMQNDDFENIDVSDLSGGIYITKITLDNGITYTDKIVIK